MRRDVQPLRLHGIEANEEVSALVANVFAQAMANASSGEFAIVLFDRGWAELSLWAQELMRLSERGPFFYRLEYTGRLTCLAAPIELVAMLAGDCESRARAFAQPLPAGAVRVLTFVGDAIGIHAIGRVVDLPARGEA